MDKSVLHFMYFLQNKLTIRRKLYTRHSVLVCLQIGNEGSSSHLPNNNSRFMPWLQLQRQNNLSHITYTFCEKVYAERYILQLHNLKGRNIRLCNIPVSLNLMFLPFRHKQRGGIAQPDVPTLKYCKLKGLCCLSCQKWVWSRIDEFGNKSGLKVPVWQTSPAAINFPPWAE